MNEITNLNKFVGHKIRDLRKKHNLSQEDFADKCGLHRTYIGAVERGERNITLNTLEKIAITLNVLVSELVKGYK